MAYYVYKITNKINNKWYIGKRKHMSPLNDSYMGSGKLIKAAIIKYGVDNFIKEILQIFDTNDEAANLEKTLVTKQAINTNMSYNMHEGGHGGFAHLNDGSKAHKERSKKGAINSTGKLHPNWGKSSFAKDDPRTIEMSKKANENRKKNGLTNEHKEKIKIASIKREEQRRLTGYYQKMSADNY